MASLSQHPFAFFAPPEILFSHSVGVTLICDSPPARFLIFKSIMFGRVELDDQIHNLPKVLACRGESSNAEDLVTYS